MTKLDRIVRFISNTRSLTEPPTIRSVKLGVSVCYPVDPMGKIIFNILATFSEFGADIIKLRTRVSMKRARVQGKLCGKKPERSELGMSTPSTKHGDDLSISVLMFSATK